MTKEELLETFDYRDGKLFWKVARKGVKIGNEAGTEYYTGYIRVMINQRHYYAHNIIAMMFFNDYDESIHLVQHVNEIRDDNRIENLKVVKNEPV